LLVGGLNAEAAMSVAPPYLLDVLARLVGKWLLVVAHTRGRARYAIDARRAYASLWIQPCTRGEWG
jgi:hypothetical protein